MIQSMRMRSNLTQEDVAHEIQLDRSTVAKWETGKAYPRAETLLRLAKIFECSVDDLLASNINTQREVKEIGEKPNHISSIFFDYKHGKSGQ